jgi:AraC-like DNA-binding protein
LENKRIENEFSTLLLMRVEERKHLSELQLKNEQLNAVIIKSKGYRRSFIIAFVGLLAAGSILVFYIILYRKKREAYRVLVRKSQQWAADTEESVQPNNYSFPSTAPDEFDVSIMNSIDEVMLREKLYTDTALSLDMLAKKLNMKRNHISEAINRCTNKNFNNYVNEYRIKEAIHILSKKDAGITIDQLSYNVGFNDRFNFYRIFKKITGLSPTEFRQNVEKEGENSAV